MRDKGYDHPLHSLDLIAEVSDLPAGAARFAIPVPQGHLVVRDALRTRGQQAGSLACYQALHRGMLYHGRAVAAFSAYGLTAAWAAHMRHWGERLMDEDDRRAALAAEAQVATPRRRALLRRGRDLWRQLGLTVRLAGL